MNPLTSLFQQATPAASTPNPPNNPMQMLQALGEVKKVVGSRNPNSVIDELVKTGRFSQAQVEQAKKMAEQMYPQMRGLF
nr:MAG TPA: Protein of unknown function (DUF2680) [Bacteriophage sp.]